MKRGLKAKEMLFYRHIPRTEHENNKVLRKIGTKRTFILRIKAIVEISGTNGAGAWQI